MLKVYICPDCGWLRVASRRKVVECCKCKDFPPMELCKLTFIEYTNMNQQERDNYSSSWRYIREKRRS